MKKIIYLLIVLMYGSSYHAQYGCFTPSLGIYDINTNAALSASLPCTYSNIISVEPTQIFSGNNATSPCMQLVIGTTNANSTTNNSLTMYQGSTAIVSLCSSTPAPCFTVIPNTSTYSLAVGFLNPTQSHSYSLCNVATASSFTYQVKSCYSNTVFASGTWSNTIANNCQGVFIPANTAIGIVSFSIAPAVPATASLSNPSGYLLLDTYQMAAGIYTVTYIFNSQTSCSVVATRTISISNPFSAAWTNLTPRCTYNSCSSLTTQVTGTSGGNFSGIGVTSNSFCPATAGVGSHNVTYTVGINSICGASQTNTIIVAPTPLANAGTTRSLTCLTNPTVLAGSGGGTYSWSHSGALGNNFSPVQNPTVSFTGTYSLVVNNGTCISTPATVAVVSNSATPNMPSTSVSSTINCINTTVTVTTSGNTSGATYLWSGPGIVGANNNQSVVVNAPGNYSFVITHPQTGCTTKSFVAVSSNTTVPLNITPGVAINCTNNVTTLTGDQPTYTYNWVAPGTGGIVSGQSTPTVTISGTGVYSVNVQNPANGCLRTVTVVPTTNTTVITPTITTPGASIITCNTTSLNLNGSPGSGVSYTWSTSNGNITGGTNTQNTTVGSGGIYTLAVTNTTNGCVGTRTISISTNTTPPSALSTNSSNIVLACPAQTAIITGTATGASSYSWIAPAGGSILSGQGTATINVTSTSAGVFTFVATGSNGCSATQAVTVSPNTDAPTFTFSNATPSITCNNNTPSVTVNITSTVTIGSYSWNPASGISGPTNTSSATFTAAGSYTVVVTATNGCISTAVIPVGSATVPPVFAAGTGTASDISCTNSLVTIAPSFTPASPNYTYTWSGPGIVGSPNNSSITVNQPGSYSLVVTETVTGCSTSSLIVPVNGNITSPNLNVSSSSSVGIGCSPLNSTVNLTATSTLAVSYLWNTGATTSVITTTTPGIYTVTVTDNTSNCSATQTIEVLNNSSAPGFTASAVGNFPCGVSNGTLQLNSVSTGTNVTYNWFGTGIISGSNTASPIVNQAGTYTVIAIDNDNGCSGTGTIAVFNPTVIANFTANIVTGAAPLDVNFTNNSLGASSYSWNFGNGSVSTTTNPSTTFPTGGNYTVTLTAENGICSDTYTLEIKVSGGLGVIPELFTPNGDTKNDVFNIPGLDNYPKNSLQVFNRWGNMIYEAKPYKNDWDGTPNKSSMGTGKLPVGTYFYMLDLGDEKEGIRKGFIQLEY